jgi:hypothetical protein
MDCRPYFNAKAIGESLRGLYGNFSKHFITNLLFIMAKKKTWLEKFRDSKEPQIKQIDKPFANNPAGSTMLIPSPQLIDQYLAHIDFGKRVDVKTLRMDLAIEQGADFTCPLTTGIFLRIVAEANFENWQQGKKIEEITPFWRAIEPNSPLAKKLSFGQVFLMEQIEKEMIR